MNKHFQYFVTVNFKGQSKNYYFGLNNRRIGYGDFIVVETSNGLELAEVVSNLEPIENLVGEFKLKPVLRKANVADLKNFEFSEKLSKEALEVINRLIEQLNLNMNPISAKYTLDLSKVLIIYVAEQRVDFRELLKLLNAELRVRIELRQIGERDKAKMVSGIGTCGMELCCKRFMKDFDMISINMAKNQNLALNISKLSGVCGKFKCCLKHENDVYTTEKRKWPKVNSKVKYQGDEYKVVSMNFVSQQAILANKENVLTLDFNEAFK